VAAWDAIWWLILGLLFGWVGLWVCDKLFLRDGQVAGLRADREAAAARAEAAAVREQLGRSEGQVDDLSKDLAAHTDQAEVLRTELAVMRNERGSVSSELQAAQEKVRIQLQELESARKLATERVEQIERLEKQVAEVQGERDKAQAWAQGKETEAAAVTGQMDEMRNELSQAHQLLATAGHKAERAQRQGRMILAHLASGRSVPPRVLQQLTGKMRGLSGIQATVDALKAADEARRQAGHKEDKL
jgi:chromosome segregation ATPase